MGGDLFVDTCSDGGFLDDLPETKSRHTAAAVGNEEIITLFLFQDERSRRFKVVIEFVFCLGAKRNQSFFAALADYSNKTCSHVTASQW